MLDFCGILWDFMEIIEMIMAIDWDNHGGFI